MRVSYKWLQDYVKFDVSPEELARRLTLAGIAVDEIEYLGENLDHVVVAYVESKEAHPASKKLSICHVNDGQNIRQIICGAPNIEAGQKVALALPGAALANGMEISVATVAGVESSGMICSGAELGINEHDNAGIMVLPENLTVGENLAEALDLQDAVLLLELTPNRADCLGIINVAREVAAVTGSSLQMPNVHYTEKGPNIKDLVSIEVQDPDLCPRYLARLVQNVKIGPSPLWMQKYLLAAGMRPINNVVDISNFVLFEAGQPSHTFDYNKLADGKIIVRRAQKGEKLTTLDDKEHIFNEDILLIADGRGASCIAGVMGGLDSEVTEETKDILIETACFDPVSIRHTSRNLNLISESSIRFEKGIDIEAAAWASKRIVQLLTEYCGGTAAAGYIDIKNGQSTAKTVDLRVERVNQFLGTDYKLEDIAGVMQSLGFAMEKEGSSLRVNIPSYRPDISLEVDLIEEVARIKGFDEISVTIPSSSAQGRKTKDQTMRFELGRACAAHGLQEVVNYSFISPKDGGRLLLPADHPWRKMLTISNPLSEEQSLMRTHMLSGLLKNIALNHSRRNFNLQFFEYGMCFFPQEEGLPVEIPTLAIALSGQRDGGWLKDACDFDYFYIKGIWESLEAGLDLPICDFSPIDAAKYPFLHPGRSAALVLDGKEIGFLGELHPLVEENYELEGSVVFLQVETSLLFKGKEQRNRCQSLPRYPATTRDMALLGSGDIPCHEIIKEIEVAGGDILVKVELFDLYDKDPIPQGQRSLAFALTFQNYERTLTDNEVNESFNRIIKAVGDKWELKLR